MATIAWLSVVGQGAVNLPRISRYHLLIPSGRFGNFSSVISVQAQKLALELYKQLMSVLISVITSLAFLEKTSASDL